MNQHFVCRSCHRSFQGRIGLSSHLSQNRVCQLRYRCSDSVHDSEVARTTLPEAQVPCLNTHGDHERLQNDVSISFEHPSRPSCNSVRRSSRVCSVQDRPSGCRPPVINVVNTEDVVPLEGSNSHHLGVASIPTCDDDDGSFGRFGDDESVPSEVDAVGVEDDDDDDSTGIPLGDLPDSEMLRLYERLMSSRSKVHLGLSKFSVAEKVQIKLLRILLALRAPLKAFSEVLNWAAWANNAGHNFVPDRQPTREKVVADLMSRHQMDGLRPHERSVYLPYSRRIVSIVYFDAREVFASLLTCPYLNKDANYFFDIHGDPFKAPERCDIGDIHTGDCYRHTYKKLVKDSRVDMILPTVMAMDKTHVDTFGRLQMEPITISYGLLKHSVRCLAAAMRILGYINHSPCHVQRSDMASLSDVWGNPIGIPSGVQVLEAPLPLHSESDVSWAAYKLNEYHMQIQFILRESGFLELMRRGFRWILHYREMKYPVVMHPYVPFIVGDTEGHDRLCGHYTARFDKVASLCRACHCPTTESGNSQANFPLRTPKEVDRLVRHENWDGLRSMSQHYLCNGFAGVRFGMHNNRGIFGACPGEMLHLISLGWFKYCLDAFAKQLSPANKTTVSSYSKNYDKLCAAIGFKLARRSDRDLPRTNFPLGFSSGANLMGHEIAGCLLVKLFALHTTAFCEIVMKRGNASLQQNGTPSAVQQFHNHRHRHDWVVFVESLLLWFEWMKQPTISRDYVRKSHLAHQYLMERAKKVAPRISGMGDNTIKRHLVLHISRDILDHGVPQTVNSAFAESAHIPLVKRTASNTQKRYATFTKQAAQRYVENLSISLACMDPEIEVLRLTAQMQAQGMHPARAIPGTNLFVSGRAFDICECTRHGIDGVEYVWKRPQSTDDPTKDKLWKDVECFLQSFLLRNMPNNTVPAFTEMRSEEGLTYRAHPNYRGQPWFDFAVAHWANQRKTMTYLPVHLLAFVDLRCLTKKRTVVHNRRNGGTDGSKVQVITPDVYAIAYSFTPVDVEELPDEMNLIQRFTIDQDDRTKVTDIYLVKASAIIRPLVGMKDFAFKVGDTNKTKKKKTTKMKGESNVTCSDYLFLMKPKKDWHLAWNWNIDDEYRQSQNRLLGGTGDSESESDIEMTTSRSRNQKVSRIGKRKR